MVEMTGKTTGPEWPAAWAVAREKLRRELGDGIFDAWIRPLTLEAYDRGEVRIGATLSFMRDRVAERYADCIERALERGADASRELADDHRIARALHGGLHSVDDGLHAARELADPP